MQLSSSASACPVPAGMITCLGSAIFFLSTRDNSHAPRSRHRFVAGRPLLGAERIGEPRLGAARAQGARLRRMRPPGGQGCDLEFGRDAPLLITETRAVEFGGTQHCRAA